MKKNSLRKKDFMTHTTIWQSSWWVHPSVHCPPPHTFPACSTLCMWSSPPPVLSRAHAECSTRWFCGSWMLREMYTGHSNTFSPYWGSWSMLEVQNETMNHCFAGCGCHMRCTQGIPTLFLHTEAAGQYWKYKLRPCTIVLWALDATWDVHRAFQHLLSMIKETMYLHFMYTGHPNTFFSTLRQLVDSGSTNWDNEPLFYGPWMLHEMYTGHSNTFSWLSIPYWRYVSFHGQMTIRCNTKVFDIVRHGNTRTTYSHTHGAWEGGRERPRLSTRGCNHCLSLVVSEFKLVYCYPGFNVINTLLHGEDEISDLMRGCSSLELRVISIWVVKDRKLFNDSGKKSCVKNRVRVWVCTQVTWHHGLSCSAHIGRWTQDMGDKNYWDWHNDSQLWPENNPNQLKIEGQHGTKHTKMKSSSSVTQIYVRIIPALSRLTACCDWKTIQISRKSWGKMAQNTLKWNPLHHNSIEWCQNHFCTLHYVRT